MEIVTVEWDDPRAVALRDAMGVETNARYADLVGSQSPDIQRAISDALAVDPADIEVTILAVEGDTPLGHSALRPWGQALEVKKVFVPVEHRNRGVARSLMLALERIARERGVPSLVLQTGDLQVEAIALYDQLGYTRIPPFRDYAVIPFEVCMEKSLP